MNTLARRHGWAVGAVVVGTAILFWPLPGSTIIPFPKLVVLLAFSVWALVAAGAARLVMPRDLGEWILALYGVFVGAMLTRALASGLPALGLWGMAGRMNGALMYLGLAVLLWTAAAIGRHGEPVTVARAIVVAGGLTTAYGGLQALGIDVISWQVRGILSSLGNPDHTASYHALVAVAAVWLALRKDERIEWRLVAGVVATAAFSVAFYWWVNEVVQGVLLIVIAAGALGAAQLWRTGRRKTLIGLGAAAVLLAVPFILVVARTDRGALDRWYLAAAGIRMWKSAPLFGVGIGQVVDRFHLVRALEEIRAFGLDRNVDDVHCVPVQLLAMAGLWGGLPFLAFAVSGLWMATRTFFTASTPRLAPERLFALLFALWMLQAAYSPDSSAISAIGMASLGLVVGLSKRHRASPGSGPGFRVGRTVMVAAAIVLGIVTLHRAVIETMLVEIDSRVGRQGRPKSNVRAEVADRAIYARLQLVLRLYPADPAFLVKFGQKMGSAGYIEAAEVALKRSVAADSMDYQSLDVLSKQYRMQGRFTEGLEVARRLSTLMPRDPRVWLMRSMFALAVNDSADARSSAREARRRAIDAQWTARSYWSFDRQVRTEGWFNAGPSRQ
jgi:hypothetical protein